MKDEYSEANGHELLLEKLLYRNECTTYDNLFSVKVDFSLSTSQMQSKFITKCVCTIFLVHYSNTTPSGSYTSVIECADRGLTRCALQVLTSYRGRAFELAIDTLVG